MEIKQILRDANIKADDDIDSYTMMVYFNQCISEINTTCGLKLPSVINQNIEGKIYEISEYDHVNNIIANILSTYIAYAFKKTEGYLDRENPFYVDYMSLRNQFQQKYKHMIKDEYKLTGDENVDFVRGTIQPVKYLKPTRRW